MLEAMDNSKNNRGGNGQFRPLRKGKSGGVGQMDVMDRKDLRMRFRNSRDPLYIAFDYLDSKPMTELAKDFVKDSIFDFVNFVSFNTLNNSKF